MSKIGVGWATWELAGSPWWLGLMAWADLFPYLVVTPFAGVVADRFDRLLLTRLAQIILAVISLILAFCALSGNLSLHVLFVLTLVGGIIGAIEQPARLSLVVSLVPAAQLSSAIAVNSLVFNLARVLGPMLGGPLIAVFGVASVFIANALATIIFAAGLFKLRGVVTHEKAPTLGVLAEIGDGLAYLYRHKGLFAVLVVFLTFCLSARSMVEMLPAFSGYLVGWFGILDGAIALSVLTSVLGVGAMVGTVFGAVFARGEAPFGVIAASGLLSGVAVVILGLSDNPLLLLPAVLLLGVVMMVGGVAVQVTLQLAVDPARRGRTTSTYSMIVRGSPGLGALIIGAASETVSLGAALVGAGGATVLICAVYWLRRSTVERQLLSK